MSKINITNMKEKLIIMFTVIKELKESPKTMNDLVNKLEDLEDLSGYNVARTKRTIYRVFEEIALLFDIEISYNREINKYCISLWQNETSFCNFQQMAVKTIENER